MKIKPEEKYIEAEKKFKAMGPKQVKSNNSNEILNEKLARNVMLTQQAILANGADFTVICEAVLDESVNEWVNSLKNQVNND